MAAASLKVLTIFSAIDKVSPTFGKISKRAESMQRSMDRAARASLAIGGAIVTAAGGVLNEFIKFEDASANVLKVFNGSDAQFKKFEKGLLEYARTTRTTIPNLQEMSVEIAKMGVAGDKVLPTLKQLDKLGLALGDNFAGGMREAVKQTTKMALLYQDLKDLDIVDAANVAGNVLNELVQRLPITEADKIVDFAQRAAGIDPALVPKASSAMALGGTLTALGMNPEAAASGFQRSIRQIMLESQKFAKFMGISNDELVSMVKTDAAKFMLELGASFKGLEPDVRARQFKQLGLNLIYSEQVMNRMANEGGVKFFTEALELAGDAQKNLNSLSREAAIVNNTTAAKISKLKNEVQVLSIQLGENLVPILEEVIPHISEILKVTSEWVSRNKELIPLIAEIGVGLLLFGGTLKFLIPIFRIVVYLMGALAGVSVIALLPLILLIAAFLLLVNYVDQLQWMLTYLDWGNTFKKLGNDIMSGVLYPFIAIFDLLSNLPGKAGDAFKKMSDKANNIFGKTKNTWMLSDAPEMPQTRYDKIMSSFAFGSGNNALNLSGLGNVGGLGGLQALLTSQQDLGGWADVPGHKPKELYPTLQRENQLIDALTGGLSKKDVIEIFVKDKGDNVESVKSSGLPVKVESTKRPDEFRLRNY